MGLGCAEGAAQGGPGMWVWGWGVSSGLRWGSRHYQPGNSREAPASSEGSLGESDWPWPAAREPAEGADMAREGGRTEADYVHVQHNHPTCVYSALTHTYLCSHMSKHAYTCADNPHSEHRAHTDTCACTPRHVHRCTTRTCTYTCMRVTTHVHPHAHRPWWRE